MIDNDLRPRRSVRRLLARLMVGLSVLIALPLGCASIRSSNPYLDAAKPHHTATGFRNNYPNGDERSLWDVLRWQWTREVPPPPSGGWQIPVMPADAAALRSNRSEPSKPTVTWVGHATVLLQIDGQNILTDPQLSERASPVSFLGPKRATEPALTLATLPHIDVVVISHNHYDHLDAPSVRGLAAQPGGSPLFVVGLGLKRWFENEGITRVVELDWWNTTRAGPLTVHFVPAHHWSTRTRFDRNQTLWGGFVVQGLHERVIYVGDTGYSADFRDIAQQFDGFDLAVMPIGGYEPRWFMRSSHIDPEEAVRIVLELKAHQAVGVHWGTFLGLTNEPLDEPPKKLAEARRQLGVTESAFFTLKIGETRPFGRR